MGEPSTIEVAPVASTATGRAGGSGPGAEEPLVRIIFVEDNPADVDLCVRRLKKDKFRFCADVAQTREELVALLRSATYDIVLADYHLPGWTALDALDTVRAEGKDIPVILVTGALGERTAVDCLKKGLADYVLKDHLGSLRSAIWQVLEEKRLKDARMRAEKALVASELRHRSLVQSAVYAIFRACPQEDRFLEANPALVEMLGYASEAELLDVSLSSVFANPAKAARLLETFGHQDKVKGLEAEWKRKDGTLLTVRMSGHRVRNQPLTAGPKTAQSAGNADKPVTLRWECRLSGEEIAVDCFEMIAENVTESKRFEQALARLAAVVESSDDAIVVRTPEGTITNWNSGAQRMYGYTAEEATGRPITLILPAGGLPEGPAAPGEGESRSSVCQSETVRMSKTGRRIPVLLTVSTVRDPAGHIVGISESARDITQRKRLEDQLRQQNRKLVEQNRLIQQASRMKSEFLANMSHELRSPLNCIIGFAEMMHDGKLGAVSAGHEECLGDILSSARHLLRLINDVLDLAKVESGKLMFRPESVSLESLVGEVTEVLHGVTVQKDIRIETDISPELGCVIADPARLKQILYNYLSNALKFTPEQGRVTVRVEPEGATDFRVEVEDSGIGIRPEDLGRLFSDFQQLDSGEGKRYQGTGLGLSLTKRIVEAQGGQVGVRSTPGAGSTFYAVLPRVFEDRPARLSQQAATVLIVEDASAGRARLARRLRAAGFRVEIAGTGEDAMAKCQAGRFAAITLDLLLPGISGWELLEAIRKGPNRHTPVVAISAVMEPEAGAACSIHDFFPKPVDLCRLIDSLRRAGVPSDNAAGAGLYELAGRLKKAAPRTMRPESKSGQTVGIQTPNCDGKGQRGAKIDEPSETSNGH